MPVIDAITKSDRLLEVQILFRQRPEGVRTAEIASLLGICQRTARRYLAELSERGRLPVYPDGRVWKLMEKARFDLLPVRLDLDEALALYLSARLLSAHSDKHNTHVVSALHKLASAMPQPIGRHIVRTAESVVRRRVYPGYLENLEKLTRAWAGHLQVRLRYRNPRAAEITERVFDTYFIDPSFVGCACYVIGHDHLRGEIRVFKVERIEQVELLGTTFEVRSDFDPFAYLAHAWGVMGGTELTEVRLRFAAGVAYRIRESDWPGVVKVEDEDGSGCVMTLRVSHVLEMKPWIRGWGADCEVLAPESLRAEIAAEMRKAAAIYGL
jgi:proteasome accessory factor B